MSTGRVQILVPLLNETRTPWSDSRAKAGKVQYEPGTFYCPGK